MRKALLTGSFDPPTVGHLDLIRRAARTFDTVTVCVFRNPDKTGCFTPEERVELLRAAVRDLPNVTVDASDGLVADYARAGGFSAIVRGVRNPADRAYEADMASWNRAHSGVPTVLLDADPALSAISSTDVRARLASGADLTGLVPAACLPLIAGMKRQDGK